MQFAVDFKEKYIFIGDKVKTKRNFEFKRYCVIITGIKNKLPRFSKILCFFQYEDKIYAILQKFNTKNLSEAHLGYVVEETDETTVVDVETIDYSKNYHIINTMSGEKAIITENFFE